MKDRVEVVRLVSQECVQQRTAEQIVVPAVAQIQEQIVQVGSVSAGPPGALYKCWAWYGGESGGLSIQTACPPQANAWKRLLR